MMERQNYEAMDEAQNLNMFTPVLILSQLLGVTAILAVAVWTGHYLGGFGWTSDPKDEVALKNMFNYHPLFMVIGLIVLYGNAILVYRIFRRERKTVTKLAHAVLQMVSLAFVVAGVTAVFRNHDLQGSKNLYTLHGILGLITVILHGLQLVFGFSAYLFPKFSASLRAQYMPVHRYFGVFIYVCSVACALMGITEKLIWGFGDQMAAREGVAVLGEFLGLVLVALCGTVVFLVANPDYRRVPLPEEEMIHLQPE